MAAERHGISASAVKTAKRCFRRWAFVAIADLPRGTSLATEFGKRCHTLAEMYLKFGVAPDFTTKEGRVFLKGMHMLPKPGSVLVEEPFAFRFAGILWDGFKDFQHPSLPFTGDHKFISNTNDYALTWDQLLQDSQAMLYALADCVKYRSDASYLDWIWYPKNQGPPKRTSGRVTLKHSLSFILTECVPTAREMIRRRAQLRAIQDQSKRIEACNLLPCNRAACFDYNSVCPYMQQCQG